MKEVIGERSNDDIERESENHWDVLPRRIVWTYIFVGCM